MKLTAQYKWDYYRLVEGSYSLLPPEKIRSRCGVNYAQKIFPDLKDDLDFLGVVAEDYPNFHCQTENQMNRLITLINRRWVKKLTEEMEKNGI